jgi:hypothetical protein
MRCRLPHLLALGALAALLAAPAGAGAATFGADLSPPVTSTATCGNGFPFAPNVTSCLGYSVTPTSYAPTSGIVSAVRVKTGDFPQGPMQVVVLRSYYQNNLQDPGHPNFFCCFLQEYGPTFTPARNAITTVPATLGMVEDPTPASNDGNTVAKGDFLALSVLAGNVPVPLAQTGAGFSGFYAPAPLAPSNPPAPSPNGLAGGQGSATGLMLMLSADIDPLDAGGGGGGGGGAPAPTPMSMVAPVPAAMRRPLAIDPTAARLRGTTASVPLVCQLTTACKGTLVLQDRPAATAAAAGGARKPRRLGSARFSIPAGAKRSVKLKLNGAGRKLVRRRHKLTAYLVATVGVQAVSTKVTLRRPTT